MLNEFCTKLDLCASARHSRNKIDYTYNFAMKRFNSFDHLIMSSVLFDSAVGDLRVQHDADNLSDHDPIFIGLSLSSNIHAMSDKIHHAKVAWHSPIYDELCRCFLNFITTCNSKLIRFVIWHAIYCARVQ